MKTVAPAPIDALEWSTALAALSAGVLWSAVYVIGLEQPDLCSATTALLGHCGLCYPAAAATLAALVGGRMLFRRWA